MLDGTLLGIRAMQLTQLLTILGGGAGYILCVNTFAAFLVSPEDRTATFGRLQGLQAFGTALGLVGTSQDLCSKRTLLMSDFSRRLAWRQIWITYALHRRIRPTRALYYHLRRLSTLHPSSNRRRGRQILKLWWILPTAQDFLTSSRREWR